MDKKTTLSLEDKVGSLMQRLDELERRLKAVERDANRVSTTKKRHSGHSSSTRKRKLPNHNYLKKTIEDVKRRYEQEYQI